MSLTTRTPAKVNLWLEIQGTKPNGMHRVETWMTPISLYDTLTLTPGKNLAISVPGHPKLENPQNLVMQASQEFFRKLEKKPCGYWELEKNIPVGAGLGGGSSDAATALNLLNKAYKYPFNYKELSSISTSLGADIPFFLKPGPRLAAGTGSVLHPAPVPPTRWMVLIKPAFSVNTSWAYGAWNRASMGLTSKYRSATESASLWGGGMFFRPFFNALEPIVQERYPRIQALLKELRLRTRSVVLMSGSGSCVFALLENEQQATLIANTFPLKMGEKVFVSHILGKQ